MSRKLSLNQRVAGSSPAAPTINQWLKQVVTEVLPLGAALLPPQFSFRFRRAPICETHRLCQPVKINHEKPNGSGTWSGRAKMRQPRRRKVDVAARAPSGDRKLSDKRKVCSIPPHSRGAAAALQRALFGAATFGIGNGRRRE